MTPYEDTLGLYDWAVAIYSSTPHNVDRYGYSVTESTSDDSEEKSDLFFMRKRKEGGVLAFEIHDTTKPCDF